MLNDQNWQLTHICIPVVFDDFSQLEMTRHDSNLIKKKKKKTTHVETKTCLVNDSTKWKQNKHFTNGLTVRSFVRVIAEESFSPYFRNDLIVSSL